MRTKLPKNYEIELVYQNYKDSVFGTEGWVRSNAADGEFNNFDSFRGITHDLFEHWFEQSGFFPADKFTIAGEVVASGDREYLVHNSYIIQDASRTEGNRYYKHDNTIDCINLLHEYFYGLNNEGCECSFEIFPEDGFLKTLPRLWNIDDYWPMEDFEENTFDYKKQMMALKPELDKYFMYGHALGYHMFDDCLKRVERLYENFKEIFLNREFFLEPFESIKYIHNQRWPKIVINNRVSITELTTFTSFAKKYETEGVFD